MVFPLPRKIASEEEFLFNLNRFNVLTSRAECKFLLVSSYNLMNFIPKIQSDVDCSIKLGEIIYQFCDNIESPEKINLPHPFEKRNCNFDFYHSHIVD